MVVWVAALAAAGCRATSPPEPSTEALAAPGTRAELHWDQNRASVLDWHADDPAFAQDHALEASGLCVSQRFMYMVAEKYATLLQLDVTGPEVRVVTVALGVPPRSELEGVAHEDGTLYLCDERHAAVYSVQLPEVEDIAAVRGALAATALPLEGIEVRGGKIGLEGITIGPDGVLYLLLERSRSDSGECVSVIYPMEIAATALQVAGSPLLIDLEDCNWRLTDLEFFNGRLLALKTRYPGEEYEVIEVDTGSGNYVSVAELTELSRRMEREGYGNNLEGMAVTANGDMYLVSDNAVTMTIDSPQPPETSERTLLLRIPLG